MSIAENIAKIQAEIQAARKKSPRPEQDVTLVAVTKMHSPEEIAQVLAAGQLILGENRVQELRDKYPLVSQEAQWHLIGHLQHNKVKYVLDKVSLIHSVESDSVAEEINKRALEMGKVMDILVQVNIADEESKYGLAEAEVVPFLQKLSQMKGLHVKGLMNIAPHFPDPEQVRPVFKRMYQLYTAIDDMALPGIDMDILSMGMSGDFTVAVEEGANMVRIGSRIFQ